MKAALDPRVEVAKPRRSKRRAPLMTLIIFNYMRDNMMHGGDDSTEARCLAFPILLAEKGGPL